MRPFCFRPLLGIHCFPSLGRVQEGPGFGCRERLGSNLPWISVSSSAEAAVLETFAVDLLPS